MAPAPCPRLRPLLPFALFFIAAGGGLGPRGGWVGGGVVEAYHNHPPPPSFFGPPGSSSSSHSSSKAGTAAADPPKLILIGGAPGTGKSTFGMSVALDQGIIKCISTDTVRAVMRSFVAEGVSPALHRSSYEPSFEGDDRPVRAWLESCAVLRRSVEGLVDDAIGLGVGLVVEGVHIVPGTGLIQKWEEAGGVATGCLLQVSDPKTHKRLLKTRGYLAGANVESEAETMENFERVRAIQDEMMRLADESGWLRIEQRTEPDPLDMVTGKLAAGARAKARAEAAAAAHAASRPVDITQDIFRAAQLPLIEHFPRPAKASSRKRTKI